MEPREPSKKHVTLRQAATKVLVSNTLRKPPPRRLSAGPVSQPVARQAEVQEEFPPALLEGPRRQSAPSSPVPQDPNEARSRSKKLWQKMRDGQVSDGHRHHHHHHHSHSRDSSKYNSHHSHHSEESDESEKDADLEGLQGVAVNKPSKLPQSGEVDENAPVKMTKRATRIQQCRLFEDFNEAALIQLGELAEERTYHKGDFLFREGDKQEWIGFLLSGKLNVQIVPVSGDGTEYHRPVHVCYVPDNGHFGELCALGLQDHRTCSIRVDAEASMLSLEGRALWGVLDANPEDRAKALVETERWKVFLSSHLASACHPEIAYQLRSRSTRRILKEGEQITLGRSSNTEQDTLSLESSTTSLHTSAAVVESGVVFSADDFPQHLPVGHIACESVVLGVNSYMPITSREGDSHLTLVTRASLWSLIVRLHKERDNLLKLALDLLPPSTVDLASCQALVYLQGSPSFWRLIPNLVSQRVCFPGQVILEEDTDSEVIAFLQQGSAEVLVKNQPLRHLSAGGYCGETNFCGVTTRSHTTVRALELCVVQDLARSNVEGHLNRHHTVRSKFRELSKLRGVLRDGPPGEFQVKQLAAVEFFHGLSPEVLKELAGGIEDRLYVTSQVISPDPNSQPFLIILQEGSAERVAADGTTTKIKTGELLGEMGLLCNSLICQDTIVATSPCCVQTLHRNVLFSVMEHHPAAKKHLESLAKAHLLRQTGTDGEQLTNIFMLPFFKNCGSRFLYLLDLHLDRHIFFSEEEIVHEGTMGEDMFVLLSGKAVAKVKGVQVGKLGSGVCFGEMAVLGLVKKRTATVIASTMCEVWKLSRQVLEGAMDEFPEERARFESLAATRTRLSLETKAGGKTQQTAAFFKDCNLKFAELLSDIMEDRLFGEGHVIFKQGEAGDSMVLIHQGLVSIRVNGEEVAQRGAGEVIGEMSVLGLTAHRTATVVAVEVCFVQILPRAKLLPLLQKFPEELQKIRQTTATRMEKNLTSVSLRNFEFFKGAPAAFTDMLEKLIERRFFFKDDLLLNEGAEGRHLLIIMSGKADVVKEGQVIGTVGAGDIIGELAVFSYTEKRTSTVRCKDICDVLTLKRSNLRKALRWWPEQESRFRNLGASRMRQDVERNAEEKFLLKCPLFEQCSSKFIQCISMHLEDRLYMPGEYLCRQGEAGDTMFIVMGGDLECLVGGEKVSELHEGSIIGEIAVLGLASQRTASLRAMTVCLVQVLHRPIFMKYLAEFPREMIQFQEVGAARLERVPMTGKSNLFRQQTIFKDLGDDFLDRLSQNLHRKFFFANQKIIKEGTDSNEMFTVAQGRAVVEKRGAFVCELETGSAFGAMAVLGLQQAQSLTVRAETLCDMQVLSRWDLESLLKEFAEERVTLMQRVAKLLREDLAEITNQEILSEVPLLSEFDSQLVEKLSEEVTVELRRADEEIFGPGDDSLVVLLQGTAAVMACGAALRDLSEGDFFGESALLGLMDSKGVTLSAMSTCLYMKLTKASFLEKVKECDGKTAKTHEGLCTRLKGTPSMRLKMLARAPVFQHLMLGDERMKHIVELCEEGVFFTDQEIASAHMRANVMLLMMAGKAVMNGVDLDQGSCVGEISLDPPRGVHPHGVIAQTPCKVLMLHRKVFFAYLETLPSEEKEQVLSRLDTMPRQHRQEATNLGEGLRQQTDKLADQCLRAAKMGLRAHIKAKSSRQGALWRTAKLSLALNKALRDGREGSKGSAANKDAQEAKPLPKGTKGMKKGGKSLSPRRRAQIQLKRAETNALAPVAVEKTEELLCRDLRRLIITARDAAQDAGREKVRMRKRAELLRAEMAAEEDSHPARGSRDDLHAVPPPLDDYDTSGAAPEKGDAGRNVRGGRHGASQAMLVPWGSGPGCNHLPPDEEAEELRRWIAAADRRVQKLTVKVEQSLLLKEELVEQLRRAPRTAVSAPAGVAPGVRPRGAATYA